MSIRLSTIVAKLEERNSVDLTPREVEILQLVARGWVTKQIAHKFMTQPHTVDKQRAGIMEKLSAKTPAHMVFIACQRGLL